MEDMIHDIPFSICFTSPMKFQENIIQMEEAIERTGFSMQYHLTNTSPYVITKASDPKRKATEQGHKILAIVRRKLKEVHENDEENIASDKEQKGEPSELFEHKEDIDNIEY
ncbi:hypothetical protein GOP47_0014342 [Adiantum capillus-veneris]|uniref:Uncharacterized protein n=1 Tax=Adiantum capillus-veneris TaxID=13818 RepID=A0A9D4ZCD2_ADICA|nr:hypothetical protein GOP47_0014342 [Adiantum capillus-veneris]